MRKVTESMKKYIAGKQHYQCANKPGSNIPGVDGYECPLWKSTDQERGNFDASGFEIDHKEEHCINHDDSLENLQALCKMCHSVKTKKFMMTRNTIQAMKKNDLNSAKYTTCDNKTSESENASKSETESESENTTFECKCGVILASKFCLKRHQNSKYCTMYVDAKREYKCKYDGCKYVSSRSDNLARHIKKCKYYVINNNTSSQSISYNAPVMDGIKLVDFATDGIDSINLTELNQIIDSLNHPVIKLIELVNLNCNKPEYHNVYYRNIKDGYGNVYENGRWISKIIRDIIAILIDAKKRDLIKIIRTKQSWLVPSAKKYLISTVKRLSNSESLKLLYKAIKLLLVNNHSVVKTTRKSINNDISNYQTNNLENNYDVEV